MAPTRKELAREWEDSFTEAYGRILEDLLADDPVDLETATTFRQFVFRHCERNASMGYRPWTKEVIQTTRERSAANAEKMNLMRPAIIADLREKKWIEAGNRIVIACTLGSHIRGKDIGELFTSSLKDSWAAEFQGDVHTAFIDTIKAHIKEQHYYAQTLSVLQSSGMGKSRMLRKVSESVLSITYTLRKAGERGFPPGDKDVFDFLTRASESHNAHPLAISLLAATLQIMHERMKEALVAQGKEYNNFLADWNSETDIVSNNRRQILLEEIMIRAKQVENGLKDTKYGRGNWSGELGTHFLSDPYIKSMLEDPLVEIGSLLDKFDKRENTVKIIMINFDEATNLALSKDDNRYSTMRRVLGLLNGRSLWSAFLSTDSAVDIFAPKYVKDRSDRVASGALKRLPPFTAFQLNLENDRLEEVEGEGELQKSILEMSTIKHMAKFGRPLWQAYVEGPDEEILRFVEQKLIPDSETEFDPDNVDHVFSVLAFRICLDPVLNEGSTELSKHAIDFSLRVLVDVDSKNRILDTVTPSEPLVAQVAADLLNRKPGDFQLSHWPKALSTMTDKLLSSGKVQKGERGEVLSRTLLMLAHDVALKLKRVQPRLLYSQPLTVRDFLGSLLVINPVDLDMKLFKPQSRKRPTRQPRMDIFEGFVTFNHFASTRENLNATTFKDLLLRLFRQKAALQLAFVQPFWDVLIPVYCGSKTEALKKENFTAIMVQVKNKGTESRVTPGPEYPRFFRDGESVLLLQMELGLNSFEGKPITHKATVYGGGKSPHVAAFTIRGLTKNTYQVMRNDSRISDALISLRRCLVPELKTGTANYLKAQFRTFPFKVHANRDKEEGDDSDLDTSMQNSQW